MGEKQIQEGLGPAKVCLPDADPLTDKLLRECGMDVPRAHNEGVCVLRRDQISDNGMGKLAVGAGDEDHCNTSWDFVF